MSDPQDHVTTPNPDRQPNEDEKPGITLSIIDTLDNLRQVACRCLTDEPLGQDLATWLGEALDSYLTRQARTIEEALGLIFPQGGVPWWREEAMRIRDAALREWADGFLDDCSICRQANLIWTSAVRYAASAWPIDCDIVEMPARYLETPKEYLWRAFKSGAPMPIGERQLRNILAH